MVGMTRSLKVDCGVDFEVDFGVEVAESITHRGTVWWAWLEVRRRASLDSFVVNGK